MNKDLIIIRLYSVLNVIYEIRFSLNLSMLRYLDASMLRCADSISPKKKWKFYFPPLWVQSANLACPAFSNFTLDSGSNPFPFFLAIFVSVFSFRFRIFLFAMTCWKKTEMETKWKYISRKSLHYFEHPICW